MAVPHGHWMTTTFVGGLRLSGMTAPLIIDGPMTGTWFEAWVSQALAPTLRPGDPGSSPGQARDPRQPPSAAIPTMLRIAGTLGCSARPQKRRCARRDRGEGRPAALPSAPGLRRGRLYSPDFNPIENAFAKLKALLRKAAARTVDDLSRAIGTAIDTLTPAECANYFAAAGYDAY